MVLDLRYVVGKSKGPIFIFMAPPVAIIGQTDSLF